MSDMVRITVAHLDFIMDALKYAPPQVHLPVAPAQSENGEETESAPQEPSNEQKIESIRKKLYENDGTVSLDETDFGFIYDSVQIYRKYLMGELPKHKKGSAGYKKTKKALDMIPKINATFFSTMVF